MIKQYDKRPCLHFAGPMDNRMPMKEMMFATSASSADVSNSSFGGVNETVTMSVQESSLFVSLRTLSKGQQPYFLVCLSK